MIGVLFTYPRETDQYGIPALVFRDLRYSIKGIRKDGYRPITAKIIEYGDIVEFSKVEQHSIRDNAFKVIPYVLKPMSDPVVYESTELEQRILNGLC